MNLKRILLAVLVLTLVSALPALAPASPPDPSWIPGLYDDGDFDDVVTLVVAGTGHVAPGIPADLRSTPRLVGSLAHASEATPETLCPSAVQSRAPPAS